VHSRTGLLRYAKWRIFIWALSDVAVGRRVPYALTRKVRTQSRSYVAAAVIMTDQLASRRHTTKHCCSPIGTAARLSHARAAHNPTAAAVRA